jgi:diguanylate cyclase (GGDEF)-like protein/PAS domain S-box-containing protein
MLNESLKVQQAEPHSLNGLMESTLNHMDHMDHMVIITNNPNTTENGLKIIYVNDAFARISGYSKTEAIGLKPSMLQGPETSPSTLSQIRDSIKNERSLRCEMLNYTKTSLPYWIDLNLAPHFTDDDTCDYFIGHSVEVTRDRNERAQTLREIKNFEFVLSASGLAFWDLDFETDLMWRSPQNDTIFGYKNRQQIWSYEKYLSHILEEDKSMVHSTFSRARENATSFEMEYRCKWPDKSIHWLWCKGGFITDEFDRVVRAYGIESCIDEQKDAQLKLLDLAYIDELTRLANRAAFNDCLKALIVQKRGCFEYSGLFMIDLDNFKSVNNTLGHDAGDTILVEVAERLTTSLPNAYIISKFGGDEFVLLFDLSSANKSLSFNEAELTTQTIQSIFTRSLHCPGQDLFITASIGITIFNGDDVHNVDLLQQAGLALHNAKVSGKNTHRFFDQKLQLELIKRTDLENDLRHAVTNDELFLVYQPKVSSAGKVVGAEALIRWNHPTKGIISPVEFIPIAEASGLIVPIGEWVLDEALAFIKRWPALKVPKDCILSINISPIQFNHLFFVETFSTALKNSEPQVKQLMFEITESHVIANIDESLIKINKLKDQGATFSLDDFGSGFSSLNYLKLLPIDEIKIDKSFIDDIVDDKRNVAILTAIITIAEDLDLKLVIEGVESLEQVTLLNELGARVYQGFHFSKPLTETDLISFITSHT